jgi:hypothetical protein
MGEERFGFISSFCCAQSKGILRMIDLAIGFDALVDILTQQCLPVCPVGNDQESRLMVLPIYASYFISTDRSFHE